MSEEGRIVPPYPYAYCLNSDCRAELNEERGAYLHRNRENGKLLALCGECSRLAQMYDGLRLPLVAL